MELHPLSGCSPGAFRTIAGLCSSCPAGTFGPNIGATACTPCAAGFYCPSDGLSAQLPCRAGSFCNDSNLVNVSGPCQAGTYCPAGTVNATGAGPCTSGYFCTTGADRVACAAGAFSTAGQSVCSACQPGFYQKYAASTSCSQCASGLTSGAKAQICTGAPIWLIVCQSVHLQNLTNRAIVIVRLAQEFRLYHASTPFKVQKMEDCDRFALLQTQLQWLSAQRVAHLHKVPFMDVQIPSALHLQCARQPFTRVR